MEIISNFKNQHRPSGSVSYHLMALEALECAGIEWCVISGYHDLPFRILTDLDIVVAAENFKRAKATIQSIANIRIIQEKRYAPFGRTIIFSNKNETEVTNYACLDIYAESVYLDLGVGIATPREILSSRRRADSGVWVAAPEVEFICYFAKRLAKAVFLASDEAFGPSQIKILTALYLDAPDACRQRLTEFLSESQVKLVSHAIERHDWSDVIARVVELRRMIKLRLLVRHPFAVVMSGVRNIPRLVDRLRRPNGFMIAIMGPDGAGKTLLQRNLIARLGLLFEGNLAYHLRPSLGQSADAAPDPHGRHAQGTIMSLAKLGYWWVIYTVGYWFKLYPALVRQSLVVFDRYHLDLLCDPKRYRYGGPRWAAQLLTAILPNPDLYLVLDAPTDVLQTRKSEVPFIESDEQRRRYQQIAKTRPDCRLIETFRSPDAVADSAVAEILNFMESRCRAFRL